MAEDLLARARPQRSAAPASAQRRLSVRTISGTSSRPSDCCSACGTSGRRPRHHHARGRPAQRARFRRRERAARARALYKASLARRPALIEQAMVYATRGVDAERQRSRDPHHARPVAERDHAARRGAASFERALALRPDHPDAIGRNGRGVRGPGAEQRMRRRCIARRSRCGPMRRRMHSRYGGFCYGQGRYEEAADAFPQGHRARSRISRRLTRISAARCRRSALRRGAGRFARSLAIQPTPPAGRTSARCSSLSAATTKRGSRTSRPRARALGYLMWANLGDAAAPRARRRVRSSLDAHDRDRARRAARVNPNDARSHARIALAWRRAASATKRRRRSAARWRSIRRIRVLYKAAVVAACAAQPTARSRGSSGPSRLAIRPPRPRRSGAAVASRACPPSGMP